MFLSFGGERENSGDARTFLKGLIKPCTHEECGLFICCVCLSRGPGEKFPSFPRAPRPLAVLWAAAWLSCRGEEFGYDIPEAFATLRTERERPRSASPSDYRQTNIVLALEMCFS